VCVYILRVAAVSLPEGAASCTVFVCVVVCAFVFVGVCVLRYEAVCLAAEAVSCSAFMCVCVYVSEFLCVCVCVCVCVLRYEGGMSGDRGYIV